MYPGLLFGFKKLDRAACCTNKRTAELKLFIVYVLK